MKVITVGTTGITLIDDKYACFLGGRLSNWNTIAGGILLSLPDEGIPAVILPTAEHVFMALKALYFKDRSTFEKICSSSSPLSAKRLGRQVSGFKEEDWCGVRRACMWKALYLRAAADPMFTGLISDPLFKNAIFVECNPHDKIWSCGLGIEDFVPDNNNWPGMNLLGELLTELKDKIWKSKETKI